MTNLIFVENIPMSSSGWFFQPFLWSHALCWAFVIVHVTNSMCGGTNTDVTIIARSKYYSLVKQIYLYSRNIVSGLWCRFGKEFLCWWYCFISEVDPIPSTRMAVFKRFWKEAIRREQYKWAFLCCLNVPTTTFT